jgi:hypothetical protein
MRKPDALSSLAYFVRRFGGVTPWMHSGPSNTLSHCAGLRELLTLSFFDPATPWMYSGPSSTL